MSRWRRGAASALLSLTAVALTQATPWTPEEIRDYVTSGRYDAEIAHVTAEATIWLQERVARGGERLTLICDLDETLFSNLPVFEKAGYDSRAAVWTEWEARGEAPTIAPVAELLRTAREGGVQIVFLSGRSERRREITGQNLRRAGIAEPFVLLLKPRDHVGTTGEFKRRARQVLIADGAALILNLGDQESDFVGGLAERTFRLPNPFYLTH
ncbi:MAG: hypothetical protein C0518_05765 [Opitutus sp.]|nr:hypothetical protein [Opitutus sp.]